MRPVNKNAPSNRRCLNCRHCPSPPGCLADFPGALTGELKHYWNCCRAFEWRDDKKYLGESFSAIYPNPPMGGAFHDTL